MKLLYKSLLCITDFDHENGGQAILSSNENCEGKDGSPQENEEAPRQPRRSTRNTPRNKGEKMN